MGLVLAVGCSDAASGLAGSTGNDEDPPPSTGQPPIGRPPLTDLPRSGTAIADCPEQGWCWVRGRPITVDGDRRRRTAWAFGPEGTFYRWAAAGWQAAPVPTRSAILSGWVRDEAAYWVSDAEASAWFFDGERWTEAPLAGVPIFRVMAGLDDTAWAMAGASSGGHGGTNGGDLYRWSDGQWRLAVEGYGFCLGGDFLVHAGAVYTAGLVCRDEGGVIGAEVRRRDGDAWVPVGELLEGANWYPSLSVVDDRVTVSALGGRSWDGEAWRRLESVAPPTVPEGQVALADGVGFSVVPESTGCDSAYRLDQTRAWCVAKAMVFGEHPDGWVATIEDPFAAPPPLARWGELPPDFWLRDDVTGIWGASPSSIYRIRDGQLEHYDGVAWTPQLVGETVRRVHGASEDNAWALTDDAVFRLGGAPQRVALPDDLGEAWARTLHAVDADAVLLVDGGTIHRFNGAWSVVYVAPDDWRVQSVAGRRLNGLSILRWPGGRAYEAVLERYDGTTWREIFMERLGAGDQLAHHPRHGTWLRSRGHVEPVDGSRVSPIELDWTFPGWSTPYLTDDAAWVSNGHQTQRWPLPAPL